MSNGLVLDTQVFDRLVDGLLNDDKLVGYKLVVTHIQRDELNRAPHSRRTLLITEMDAHHADSVPTASSIWDDTSWDEGQFSADDHIYERMLSRLQELDPKSKKLENQSRDIRISETALELGLGVQSQRVMESV